MIRPVYTRACALALMAALSMAPAHAQDKPAESETSAEEIYEIMIACTAYSTLAAQIAGEEATGPYRDLSARYTRAAVYIEPSQSAEVVDQAVMGSVGQLLIRRMDEKQKDKVDADFAVLDKSCKDIDTRVLTGFLAEMEAKKP